METVKRDRVIHPVIKQALQQADIVVIRTQPVASDMTKNMVARISSVMERIVGDDLSCNR